MKEARDNLATRPDVARADAEMARRERAAMRREKDEAMRGFWIARQETEAQIARLEQIRQNLVQYWVNERRARVSAPNEVTLTVIEMHV